MNDLTGWHGRRVAITGGTGFIGSNLAAELLHRGARVRLVDNLERGRLSNIAGIRDHVEFIECDLRRADEAIRSLAEMDVVFHLAAQVGGIKVYQDKAGSVLNSNLLIDQQVFAAVVAHNVPEIFYASSAHVYPKRLQQNPESAPLKEVDASPADPVLSYGWGKLVGEIALLALAAEHPWMRVSVARIMGAYGYNQDVALETGSVIPVFCHRAIRWPSGAPFCVWGTGRETRSYVFIDDVVEGILRSVKALASQRVVGPFNLASEGRVTIRELAERIIRISGKEIPIEFEPTASTTIWGQAADVSLGMRLLPGWHPRVSLEAGLELTYRHIAQHVVEHRAKEKGP